MAAVRGVCAITFFGAMVFYTVPVEMSYLLDDLGVKNSGVIGLATAVSSAATVGGAITFARLKRSPPGLWTAVFRRRVRLPARTARRGVGGRKSGRCGGGPDAGRRPPCGGARLPDPDFHAIRGGNAAALLNLS